MCILLFSNPIHRFFLIFIQSNLLGGYQKAKRESWAKLEHLFFAVLRHAKFFPCANNCNQLASLLSRAKFIIICIVSENFFAFFRWFSFTSRSRPPLLMIYHHQNSYKSNEKITMKKTRPICKWIVFIKLLLDVFCSGSNGMLEHFKEAL